MSEHTMNLINAIATGNAVETETAFNAAISDKISTRLDAMRTTIAQNMFKEKQVEEPTIEVEEPAEISQSEE
jgi:iron-sulfur cluster repair protein YtfE (RIC family)